MINKILSAMSYRDGKILKADGSEYPYLSKPSGHRIISVWHDGKTHKLQYARVVWLLVHGAMPEKEIDHIDGDATNNDISNLRLANRAENNWNKPLTATQGVHKHGLVWRAEIMANGVRRRVSGFETREHAIEFRQLMQSMLHGEFARI